MATQRRELHFENIHQVLDEVERLAATDVKTLGNYTFPQILEHLATTMDIATRHIDPPGVPALIRMLATLFRSFVINRPMKPGVKLPKKAQPILWPEKPAELDSALQHFRESFARYLASDLKEPNPVFGRMSREEYDKLQCRHSELHLSFVTPVTS